MNIRNVGPLIISSQWSQKDSPQSLTADHFLMMESERIFETPDYFPLLKKRERYSEVITASVV
jgi:hypothetical protein